MPQPIFNVSAAIFQNETNFCLRCVFHNDSASACVLIYYNSLDNTHPDNLIFLNIWKIDQLQMEAYDCIENPNPNIIIANQVAVFAFSSEKGMVYGQPLNITWDSIWEGMLKYTRKRVS